MTESAAATVQREADRWAEIATAWHPDRHPEIWADVPGSERAVIPEVDPMEDLQRRAARWGYPMQRADLADLALFAAGLARVEAGAWGSGTGSVATRALEERRFLAGDRILPWALPWLHAIAASLPGKRTAAEAATVFLLAVGEQYRPSPDLTGPEGIYPSGYDGYGPAGEPTDVTSRVRSLWGGAVVLRRTRETIVGGQAPSVGFVDGHCANSLRELYLGAAVHWSSMARGHPGTAGYWRDLARRAATTATLLD